MRKLWLVTSVAATLACGGYTSGWNRGGLGRSASGWNPGGAQGWNPGGPGGGTGYGWDELESGNGWNPGGPGLPSSQTGLYGGPGEARVRARITPGPRARDENPSTSPWREATARPRGGEPASASCDEVGALADEARDLRREVDALGRGSSARPRPDRARDAGERARRDEERARRDEREPRRAAEGSAAPVPAPPPRGSNAAPRSVRGRVVAVAPGRLWVERPAGDVVPLTVGPRTRAVVAGRAVSASEIPEGAEVRASGPVTADGTIQAATVDAK